MLPSLRRPPRARLTAVQPGPTGKPAGRPTAACLLWQGGRKLRLNAAARRELDKFPAGRRLLRRTMRALMEDVLIRGARASCCVSLGRGRTYRMDVRPVARGTDARAGALCRLQVRGPRRAAHAETGAKTARLEQAALDHLPYPVWLTDDAGRVTHRNLAARHMLRRPGSVAGAEAVPGGELWPLHVAHPDDREAVADRWQQARLAGEPLQVCCRLHLPTSDSFRWHMVQAQPRHDANAQVVGWVATVVDQQHEHEMREDLRVAACLRTDFLRVASHELSTPLTSLQLALQLAASRIKRLLPDEQLRAPVAVPLHRALDDTRRLVDIVSDLLDIKRLQLGKFFLRRSRANLGAVLQDMLTRLDKPLHDAGCTLDFHQGDAIEGDWDVVRLQQVFFHLLSNVIKYAPGTCLHVRCGAADGAAYVAFEDEGPGIPSGARKRIFSLFERATEVRGTSGLGIGLYLCRRIVHAHHGNLRLISRTGKGAKFVLSLPQAAQAAPAPSGAIGTAQTHGAGPEANAATQSVASKHAGTATATSWLLAAKKAVDAEKAAVAEAGPPCPQLK